MLQRYLRMLVCLAVCCMALPLSAATKKPVVTVDRSMSFRALTHTAYLEFRWKRYPVPSAFKMYTIVRSEPGGPTAPEEGDIVATTTNRYSTNVEDRPPHQGTYYYRLCVTKKDDNVVCSKAIKVVYEGLVTSAATQAIKAAASESRTIVSSVAPTTTRLVVPILDAAPGEMIVTIDRTAGDTANVLSSRRTVGIEKREPEQDPPMLHWTTALQRDATFQKYILVRSFTSATPSYPYDGYLVKIADVTASSFVDTVYVAPEMTNATRWYRVCSIDSLQTVRCGAPAAFTPQ